MKRNMDLAREILRLVEDSETDPIQGVSVEPLEEKGYSRVEVHYHIKLLYEAGLVDARDYTTNSGFYWQLKALTWEGHDFLEAARNDNFWTKAKDIVLSKTGGLTFETLKAVLIQLGKTAVFGELNISP